MSTIKDAEGYVTLTLAAGRVTEVGVVQGRAFRDGELETAIADVVNQALAGAAPSPNDAAQLNEQVARTEDLVRASSRNTQDAIAAAQAMTERLTTLAPPAP